MLAVVMWAVLMLAPITAVGGRTVATTLSSAEPITTIATATTISTAIALAFIILAAAGFMGADMGDMVEVAGTGSRGARCLASACAKATARQVTGPIRSEPWNALGGTRTHDPGIRNPLLYPAELRALIHDFRCFLYSQSPMPGMKWKATKIDNLIRDENSGRYYARFWRDGKPKWITLKTDIYAVAKARIDKERQAFNAVTETVRTVETGGATVETGGATAEKCARAYLDQVNDKVSIKETTAHYYRQIVEAILESWPELKITKPKDISKRGLETWAKRFSEKYSAQRFNNSVDVWMISLIG